MTATVVGVMDRDDWGARTDNVVVVDGRRRRVVWVPRDLWSRAVGDRINEAFARGGHELLQAAVREHRLRADGSLVLLRSAVEQALDGASVTVLVDRRRRYWYPLEPTLRLEDGRKLVAFDPLRETLRGERIHQWLGARQSGDGPVRALPDLDRIERQQLFVRALLRNRFPFEQALDDPALVSSSGPGAVDALGAVEATWAFAVYTRFRPATIDGKMVLLRSRRRLLPRAGRARR